ncbi:RNA 2',3'-cyclic phosphodiesterase [bacterium]|nr:RNA 2',3'-cyclic phosphodiesterase [bacterium]
MNLIRAFLAIEIPVSIKQGIGAFQDELRESGHGVSWVKAANLHITLKFLGNIDWNQRRAIIAALPEVCQNYDPFSIRVKETGVFPNVKQPRIFWVGCSDSKNILGQIFLSIDKALTDIGFEPEARPFSPHLTIGRIKQPYSTGILVSQMQKNTFFSAGQFQASSVKLIKSELHPGGAIYTPIAEFQLGK